MPASVYPDPITQAIESPLLTAKSVVFDMSDNQPPAFGATAGQGEWGLFQKFLQDPKNVTGDRKSTRLNSSHSQISYAVFCLKKKTRPNLHKRAGDLPLHRDRHLGRVVGQRALPQAAVIVVRVVLRELATASHPLPSH